MNDFIDLPHLPECLLNLPLETLHDIQSHTYHAIKADRQQRGEPVNLDRYDAGLLGGQDGMPAYVWHDIIRSELDRAYDFYMDQIDRAAPQPAEDHVERASPAQEPSDDMVTVIEWVDGVGFQIMSKPAHKFGEEQ